MLQRLLLLRHREWGPGLHRFRCNAEDGLVLPLPNSAVLIVRWQVRLLQNACECVVVRLTSQKLMLFNTSSDSGLAAITRQKRSIVDCVSFRAWLKLPETETVHPAVRLV